MRKTVEQRKQELKCEILNWRNEIIEMWYSDFLEEKESYLENGYTLKRVYP